MHSSKSYCEKESFETRERSVCVIADLHEGKYSQFPIWLCLRGPKRHVFPYVCTHDQSVASLYPRVFWVGATAVSFPCMSNRSVHPPEAALPKPRATSCLEKTVSRDRGVDQSETRFHGQETEAWMEKRILSHGATFRSLLACSGSLWFLDLTPESPTNGERPLEDLHTLPCVKGAALWLLWDQIKH